MTNPYDSAYRDPDPDPLVDGGQGRTIDERLDGEWVGDGGGDTRPWQVVR